MGYVDLLILYNLILWAIVGTYMAVNVLRKWFIFIFKKDPAEIADELADKLDKAAQRREARKQKREEKRAAKIAKLNEKAAALAQIPGKTVNAMRTAVADGLDAAEQEIRPDDDPYYAAQ